MAFGHAPAYFFRRLRVILASCPCRAPLIGVTALIFIARAMFRSNSDAYIQHSVRRCFLSAALLRRNDNLCRNDGADGGGCRCGMAEKIPYERGKNEVRIARLLQASEDNGPDSCGACDVGFILF